MACTCKPGKKTCNSCLNTNNLNGTNRTSVPATVKPNGEYTISQLNVFQQNFQNNMQVELQTNPLTTAVKRYGNSVYDSVNQLNSDILQRDYIKEQLPNYEVLNKRLQYAPITPLEFASFIKDSNYTPSAAIQSANANGSRFLNELDDFYNGDFSNSVLGGFCALFGSVFAAIGGFFDLIGSIDGLIQDALSFINKIKNLEDPIKAFFEKIKVKALIEAIKEKITKTIEKTIDKVKKMIENFSVENIVGEIKSFVQKNIVAKVEKIKEDIQQFFSEENIKKIKDKIKGIIDYGVSLFQNPSLEEIQFLIARICSLATGIEGLIKGLKGPLDDFANRYDEVFNSISNASNRITGEAIRAGAIRLAPEVREEQINRTRTIWEKAGNFVPITAQEYSDLPSWETLKAGSDSRLKIQGGWVTRMKPASEGWTKMDRDVRVMVMRLQKAAKEAGIINGHIYLNSGYRSPAYNEDVDGAKASQHLDGFAADLTWDGYSPTSDSLLLFANMARRQGFKGIGYYNGFCHVDVGPERFWDKRTNKSVSAPTVSAGEGAPNGTKTTVDPALETPTTPEETISRNDARRMARENESDVEFVENGVRYIAKYNPPTQENRVGFDAFGDKIETEFRGSVVITPVSTTQGGR